jgi:hypothetical protein
MQGFMPDIVNHSGRFILALMGESRLEMKQKVATTVPGMKLLHTDSDVDMYSSGSGLAHLKDELAEFQSLALMMHGVAFPREEYRTSDTQTPSALNGCLRSYSTRMKELPLAFANGSYVLIASDTSTRTGYAYTSFLNSIPLYYTVSRGCLAISTDLVFLAHLTDRTIDNLDAGLLEYYVLGTNLSTATGIDGVYSLPKGAWLSYHQGRLQTGFYHILPPEESGVGFDECVERFAGIWSGTMDTIQSTNVPYGLGLTGGIDSRLILAGMRDKKTPLLFTGSNTDHPDWLLAKYMTERLGLKNHVLEDYTNSDKLLGFAQYCSLSDNPLHVNHLYYMDKLMFRVKHGMAFELIGLTEFLGGVYHYRDRRSCLDTLRMSGPLRKHSYESDNGLTNRLILMSLRNQTHESDLGHIPDGDDLFQGIMTGISELLISQLGDVRDEESFLERFRHIHKMANLLTWSHLANRRYLECFSPSMNVELTDLACRIPLKHRENRKLLFAYLKKYHPELAIYPLSGYIFSPNAPWIVYKLLAPQIKAMNHLGIKVPYKQWYIRKGNFKDIDAMPEVYEFQRRVCRLSPIVVDSSLGEFLNQHPGDHTRLMRCFNIALLNLKLTKGEEYMADYLEGIMQEVIIDSGNNSTHEGYRFG